MTGLERHTRLRRRSKKRAAQERTYTRLHAEFMAAHPQCARCGMPSQELHHRAGRQGWRLTYVPWFIALCAACHRHVTEHPVEAFEHGWSLPRVGLPDQEAS